MVKSIGQAIQNYCTNPIKKGAESIERLSKPVRCFSGLAFMAAGVAIYTLVDRRFRLVRIAGAATATFGGILLGHVAFAHAFQKKQRVGVDLLFEGSDYYYGSLPEYPEVLSRANGALPKLERMTDSVMKGEFEGRPFIVAMVETKVTKEAIAKLRPHLQTTFSDYEEGSDLKDIIFIIGDKQDSIRWIQWRNNFPEPFFFNAIYISEQTEERTEIQSLQKLFRGEPSEDCNKLTWKLSAKPEQNNRSANG